MKCPFCENDMKLENIEEKQSGVSSHHIPGYGPDGLPVKKEIPVFINRLTYICPCKKVELNFDQKGIDITI